MLKLLPLSYNEMLDLPLAPFYWKKNESTPKKPVLPLRQFWELIIRGSYPELAEHPEKDPLLWHESYIQTYLERDIRGLRQIGDLTQFQLFLRAVAARSGQLFQMSDVAKDIGVSVNTIKGWLGVLEATFQVIILRPHFANIMKRLVKTPKVYFTDVGTLCYLLGLRDIDHLASGPMAGALAETFIFSEIYKRISNQGFTPQIYFWRTSTGTEVDIIIEDQGKLIPIEVKASSTPTPHMAKGIISFQKDLGKKATRGYVVHLGDLELPLKQDVLALPFAQL